MTKMANEWSEFACSPQRDGDRRLQVRVRQWLVQFLNVNSLSPESLKFGSTSDIFELKDAVMEGARKTFGTDMNIGTLLRLQQFVDNYVHNIV